ncbi:MAG TPA: metalloregulator ArsR/SmtB family transcription factor, partial [Trueperaceae bacterium]|nr:metalloregulator ArsR/SmtB family transcription factor [Trueperaceae bacterium]
MSEARLDATFMALADPTRRAILARLAESDATVKELAAPFAISQPAVSKHLKLLERAGLVEVGRLGASRPRRLVVEPLTAARAEIERYRQAWESNFRRLDVLLDELQQSTD